MSTIQNVPSWARPDIDAFRANGHLPGEGVKRQAISAVQQASEVERQVTTQIDQLIAADESEIDLAKDQPGKVQIDQMGLQIKADFEGNSQVGEMSLESHGPIESAALGTFTEAAADLVQVLKSEDGKNGVVAVHIDRNNPANSFIETRDVPDGFNLFGG